jgi:teichuronic acid biosynthesis glycosyltransferase TuaC
VASTLESCAIETHADKMESKKRRLRVLMVIPESPHTASMIFVKRQIASLQEAGIECSTFLLASRTSPRLLFREWKRLRRAIEESQPDFLHAQFGTMTSFLTVLSTARPVVISFRGGDLNPYKSRFKLRQRVGRLLSQLSALRASRIICVSAQLKERLWWRKDRVTVIPSGVDTAIFRPRPREAARCDLGWEQNERVVLFNAGTDPVSKRLDLAIASVEKARAVCGQIRLHVLDGKVSPGLIPVLMNAADCLLLTSDWEGSPNVVKEAIACNLPVVSVDTGDVQDRLAGVEPCKIVERSPGPLGAALAEVLAKRARSNGHENAMQFSLQAIAKRVASVYESVAGVVYSIAQND